MDESPSGDRIALVLPPSTGDIPMRHRIAPAAVILASMVLALCATESVAQETPPFSSARPFGTLRQQAAIQQAWLEERLEVNLPAVMRAHGVDMWVVTMREYNEDPVFRGSCRRRPSPRGGAPSTSSSTAARRRAWSGSRWAARRRAGSTKRIAARRPHRPHRRPSCGAWISGRLFARLVQERNPKAHRRQHLGRPRLRRRPHRRRMGTDEGRPRPGAREARRPRTRGWRSTTWRCGCPAWRRPTAGCRPSSTR